MVVDRESVGPRVHAAGEAEARLRTDQALVRDLVGRLREADGPVDGVGPGQGHVRVRVWHLAGEVVVDSEPGLGPVAATLSKP